MFARNPCNRRHERNPSSPSVDFVKAQQKAGAKPGFDSANVPFDLSSGWDSLAVGTVQWLCQSCLEMIACLHRTGVKMIRKLDQEDRALGHNIGGRVLRNHRKREKCD